ncbi:MAG TPA: reverse transcriptase-like protein [Patescibacteria group bacterium]|nr:reverse transcriptase-like protein [Patescibacteria group bacterium]
MADLIKIYTDGATVGKNKIGTTMEISIGIWIPHLNKGYGKRIPGISNNEAEFIALINGMKIAIKAGFKYVIFHMDSQIVCNRANGARPKAAKHKNQRMDNFQDMVYELKKYFTFVEFVWIPRERNKEADEITKMYARRKQSAKS